MEFQFSEKLFLACIHESLLCPILRLISYRRTLEAGSTEPL